MLATAKGVSLIEQKRLQWAKEREEMVGLYGLWGRPRNLEENVKINNKNNLLPPIERQNIAEPTKAEESETSGYLSDSPKHLKENEPDQERDFVKDTNDQRNNETAAEQQQYWNEVENNPENYWAEKKMYKNYKNENWAQQCADSYNQRRFYQTNKNYWHGTPESVSSDDGCRLRWGDRGLGIGHLWEPAVSHPESRLPLVGDPFRQTPKWVEKGLKNADGNQADILIIHHPDDDAPPKNFLLGQNAPIPLEVIEERERKRKKALEHQNAIKRQLEEREMKRKQERENRIREEKLEEERIKKEQEIERLRYEEEQRKMKQKEEIEKKKEEVMREAIKIAEKRAKEEKILSKRHQINSVSQKAHVEFEKKVEKNLELAERNFNNKREILKTPRFKKVDDDGENKKESNGKKLRDSSSQFEEIQLTNNFQLLNMNGMPMDGSVALMLDNPPKDNFLFPPDGVQLALLMSPRNATSANQFIPNTPLVSTLLNTGERTLTPSKYRIAERLRFKPSSKSTQTDLKYTSAWTEASRSGGKSKKQSWRSGVNSGSSGGSQKCNIEKHHKHFRSFPFSKYRLKQHTSKITLDNRPKWGINRPSVQYKKQSEKDPYYQRKIKERLKKAEELEILASKKSERTEGEKSSALTFIDCHDVEKREVKDDVVLRNGYRMNSNLSSPVFVPIGRTKWEETKKTDLDSERSRSNYSEQFESPENDDVVEDEDVVPGSVGFLTQSQLEAIKHITTLREGLKKLQKDCSISRSITPLSDKSVDNELDQFLQEMIKLDDFLTKKKEPAQVLDLSRVKITSKEEFKKNFDKIPECKVKPEKIAPDSVKIKDKEFSFFSGKKEGKQSRDWNYLDPMPPDMKAVKLEDICPVNIDWKMLTPCRPKTKVEEDIFSRLVQLGKLDLKYQQALLREKSSDWIRKTKNPKSSIVEMRVLSCRECGEDFCDGSMCSKLMYDCFLRPQPVTSAPSQSLLLAAESGEKKKKKRKKKKGKSKARKRKSQSQRRKLGKNSIFNRPVSRGCNRDHSRSRGEIVEKPRRRVLSSTRSFSTDRTRTSLFERRSKSAPRIHFECDAPDWKPKRYDYVSDSCPSQSDYSSRSDSQSPVSRRKSSPMLRLSGRRKLLSARVGFTKRSQPGSPGPSHFVRRCTLYKGYRSDSSFPDSQDEEDSSESSTPRSRSPSKSPKKVSPAPCSFARHPSTIQIQFDEDYQTPGLRFPEKMYLPSTVANKRNKTKEMNQIRNQYLGKLGDGLSKIELRLSGESTGGAVLTRRPKTGVSSHASRPRTANLSKFSGPYLKAKGLFEKKE